MASMPRGGPASTGRTAGDLCRTEDGERLAEATMPEFRAPGDEGVTVWTPDGVAAECERLADQFAAIQTLVGKARETASGERDREDEDR